jgi:CRP-like cAMP-binding protein
VQLGDHSVAELVGPGDLISPRIDISGWSTLAAQSGWHVLVDARYAELDAKFAERAAPFPAISTALVGRALLRSRYLAVVLAIAAERRLEERLPMLMWHLADRFGRRGTEWVDIPLPLTHSVIGELISARRPSVTGAVKSLTERGILRRVSGGWQILGSDARPRGVGAAARGPAAPAD